MRLVGKIVSKMTYFVSCSK